MRKGSFAFNPLWTVLPVGQICTSIVPGRNKPKDFDGDIPWITIGDLESFYIEHSRMRLAVTVDEVLRSGAKTIPENSVVMSCVGQFGIVGIAAHEIVINQQLHAFVCPLEIDPYFLSLALKLQVPYMNRIANKTTISYLNKAACNGIPIPVPSIKEQRKIAEVLETWDKAIGLLEHMIAAKQLRKKALMQLLLTGKRRFPEFADWPWQELSLGDFLRPEFRKVEKPNQSYTALSVRSHGKGTFRRQVEDPRKIAMTHLYEVEGGDLIVNITFAWEGAIAIINPDDKGCLVSHRFPTYRFEETKVDPDYFRFLMVTKRFFYELGLISPGGAGRNRVMSKKDFLKIRVRLPEIQEQQIIGELLVTCDEEIGLLAQKSEALRQQKKGLMQQLLTGKTRVKVE